MAGGKIMVFTGLIDKLNPTDAELAAVIGHEIAHAIARHGGERLSQEMLVAGLTVAVLRNGAGTDLAVGSYVVHRQHGVARFSGVTTRAVGGTTRDYPQMLNKVLGTKFKLILGYPGTRDVHLAMERKEVDGVCGIWVSSMKSAFARYVKDGLMRPIVQMGAQDHPELAGVPNAIRSAVRSRCRAPRARRRFTWWVATMPPKRLHRPSVASTGSMLMGAPRPGRGATRSRA